MDHDLKNLVPYSIHKDASRNYFGLNPLLCIYLYIATYLQVIVSKIWPTVMGTHRMVEDMPDVYEFAVLKEMERFLK